MSADFVLDASAVAKTFLDEEHAPAFRTWFEATLRSPARLSAPALLAYELAYVIQRVRSRLDYPADDPVRGIVREATLAIDLDDDAWARIDPYLDLVGAYDATYLALAVAKSATLVTYDRRLAAAAERLVPVLTPT